MKTLKWNANHLSKLAGLSAIAVIAVAGCTGKDTTGDGQAADSPGAAKMENAGEQVANGVKEGAGVAADAATNAVAGAGNAVAGAADAAGNAVAGAANSVKGLDDAATITPKLKSVYGANAALKGSNINVSTNNTSVILSGTVKNQAQKKVANNLAKQTAPNYKIVDQLKVQ
jgi:osmotically-inducible protein OsmY